MKGKIICNNLNEFFNEFKKIRTEKSNIANKENFKHYWSFWGQVLKTENQRVTDELVSVSMNFWKKENRVLKPKKELVLKLPNLKEKEWENYSEKIIKVLQEIWETGEVKDYQGLDLNWPVDSTEMATFCDQCHKYICEDRKSTYFSDIEKNLDFCSEGCYSKFFNQEHNKQEKNKNNTQTIITYIAVGNIFVAFALLFFCRLKLRKKRTLKS